MNKLFVSECIPPILSLTFQGEEAHMNNLEILRDKVRSEIRSHEGCCSIYLLDIRAFRGRPDIVQLIKIAERMPTDIITRPLLIVDLPENRAFARQSETILRNRMLNVRYFTDMQEAMERALFLAEIANKK